MAGGRQAKVQITADVGAFKKQIDAAKETLKGLGQVDVSPETIKKFSDKISKDLADSASKAQSRIAELTKELDEMAGSNAFDPKKAQQLTAAIINSKKHLKEFNDLRKEIKSGGFGSGPSSGGGGGAEVPGAGGGGMFSKIAGFMKSGAGKLLGLAGVGLGAREIMNRREAIADQRLPIRALTRDAKVGSDASAYGYSPAERRGRKLQIAEQVPVSSKQLDKLTTMSEKAERAYGIGGGQFAQAVGAAKRSGTQDPAKFAASAIGAAVAAKLEGGNIGGYLASMSGYLESMSEGVNIDSNSLNGFAGALVASSPFFKQDPSRAFGMIRGLDQSFRGGDAFQQAQSARAILQNSPGSNPAAVNIRKNMGLFYGDDRLNGRLGAIEKQNGRGGGLQSAMGVKGIDIIQKEVQEILNSTKDMTTSDELQEFMSRLGIENQQGAEFYAGVKESGGKIDEKQFKKFKEAKMDPVDRLAATFKNFDGSIKSLTTAIEQLKDRLAIDIGDPMVELGHKILGLTDKLGGAGTPGEIAGDVVATGIAGGAALAGGRAVVKGGEKAAAAGGKILGKAMPKTMAKMAPKFAKMSKAIPILGTLTSAAFAAKDTYDIYQKWKSGKPVSNKEWAILSADLVSMVPVVGTGATIASIGLEALDDDALGYSMPMNGKGAAGTPGGAKPASPNAPAKAPRAATSVKPATGTKSTATKDGKKVTVNNTVNEGAKVIQMPGTKSGGDDSDDVTAENTIAVRENTAALRAAGGGRTSPQKSPYPEGATSADGKPGKPR